jgi:hypothetical protein
MKSDLLASCPPKNEPDARRSQGARILRKWRESTTLRLQVYFPLRKSPPTSSAPRFSASRQSIIALSTSYIRTDHSGPRTDHFGRAEPKKEAHAEAQSRQEEISSLRLCASA